MLSLLHSLLVITAAISTANAMPWGPGHGNGGSNWWNGHGKGKDQHSTPTLPLCDVDNTGPSPLPKPPNSPKYITLGLGFQNYTCNATGSWIQTTPSAGAIASLYDISHAITQYTHDDFSRHTLESFQTCLEHTSCTPCPENNYCGKCHSIAAARFRRNQIGFHFFDQLNGAQTPNFNLFAGVDFLSVKKAGSIKAPSDAYDGENGLGAVDWLYLVDNGLGRTHGLKSVYRVETAGGVAPSSCGEEGSMLAVPYAAEYWFYD